MPHIHEKIDFTVEVFVVHKNKVLLRKHDKYKLWLSVGGHIELDEEPNEAAVREVKEEVGLDVQLADDLRPFNIDRDDYTELIPPKFLNIHDISEAHRHIALTYFATSDSDDVTQGDVEQSDEWHWFTEEELDDETYGIRESVCNYAKQALAELGE